VEGKLINGAIEVRKSCKAIGKYEAPLIATLCNHFVSSGFSAFPHVRLNVAWSAALSDIDTLLIRDQTVIAIEVKSRQDNFSRAEFQLERLRDFVDYSYVATEIMPRNFSSKHHGLLLFDDGSIKVVKRAPTLQCKPRIESLMALPKKCLFGFLSLSCPDRLTKHELTMGIVSTIDEDTIKRRIKEIVLCPGCANKKCML
jgi:hypothetical protein